MRKSMPASRPAPGGATLVPRPVRGSRPRGLLAGLGIAAAAMGGCASQSPRLSDSRLDHSKPSRTGVSASDRVLAYGQPVPKGGGVYKLGSPYQVSGRWYVPKVDPHYDRVGLGSWYGADFHGRRTANGEIFDMDALVAAHPTLPLPSYAWVTNLDNGRTILVRVNDRGPYVDDRMIDLSRQAARLLDYERKGTTRLRVRYAGHAPLDGNDVRERQYLASEPWAAAFIANGPAPAPLPRVAGAWDGPPAQPPAPQPAPPYAPTYAPPPPAYTPPPASGGWTVASYRAALAPPRR